MVAPVNVTGNYFQIIGAAVPAGLTPRIRVHLSEAAVTEDEAVSQVVTTFTPTSGGGFTLPLIPTDQMRPTLTRASPVPPHYVVEFDAADPSGSYRTAPERFELFVPSGGGPFMQLVTAPPVGGWVEVTNVGPGSPADYGVGVLIVDTSDPLPFLSYTA